MMNNKQIELIGDNHISSNINTPLLKSAFDKTHEVKIASIQNYFAKIMEELGLDLSDDCLSGTPHRFAKMYVKELMDLTQKTNQSYLLLRINMGTRKCWYNKILPLTHHVSTIFFLLLDMLM